MKRLFLAVIALSLPIIAQEKPTFTQAKIKQATVYFTGAALTHTASANIPKGTSELVIKNVANTLSEETIRVLAPSNVTVLSAQFTNQYMEEYDAERYAPSLKRVQDSLTLLDNQLKKCRNERHSKEKTVSFLDGNNALQGHQDGLVLSDIPKVMDYYTAKRIELLNSIDEIKAKEETLSAAITKLNAKLDTNVSKQEHLSNGKIILQLMSPVAQKADFQISYISTQATWYPSYELRGEKLAEPIHLLYKGQIAQNTGVDWKGVKLALSSGNPNKSNQFPVLKTWFVQLGHPRDFSNATMELRSNAAPLADLSRKKIAKDEVVHMEESTMAHYTALSENQLNISFDIDTPYDILSNGKVHSISLQELQLKATYKYYTAPRVDKEVYLVAAIEDYSKYNLLPGEANIVFEDLYVGKTYIDPNQTAETLNITMGNDKKISVKREKVVDKSQTKFISANKEQIFTYDIILRNNKKEPVNLVLKDQYPVSIEKSIEVELLESSHASVAEETHILTWEVSLKPNETKTFRISYKLKYPKDMTVN